MVHGRVQGVGFRFFVVRQAGVLGLAGWVRNRADGSVEVVAEGSRTVLTELVEAVRKGPQGARVHAVDESWAEGPSAHRGFEVRNG